ncbi:MAG: tetratricopeptide repeat protein [Anaerolineales bacterium]|nr:tetratricopeptide repeat protein [Anaerolineales bacterium]
MAQRTSTGANLLAAQYRLRGNEWQYLGGAWVRQLLNEILFETIQTDDPEKLFRDNFARFESLGDRRGIIRAVMHLGNIAFMKEEYDKAQGNFQIALDHALALGEKWGAAGCYHKLGQVARARGNYPLALQIFQDGLELLKKVDDPRRTGFILRELGGVARVQGEHSASWEYYRESLQIAKKIGAEALALETLTGVASLLAETGEPERGVALLTLALTHPASEQLTQNRAAQTLQILHERGTKDTVTQEHGKGRSQPLEETIESILGNSIVSRSNEHGKHFF